MIQKLEKYLFYLFIFCVPFQTRIILANWAPARVGFNEWTSAFLQITDILIVGLLLLWFLRWRRGETDIKFRRADIFLGGFFAVSALSILASGFKGISGYQLVKLAEFILFYFYIRSSFDKVFDMEQLAKALVATGLFQALIAIMQYSIQGGLGLKIFGESPITPGGAGVASFYVGTEVFLRAYGTFPHPNILATFLMLSLVAFCYLYFKKDLKYLWVNTVTSILVYAVMLYGLLATYSRTVIGLMGLAVVVFLVLQIWHRGVRYLHNKRFYILAIVSLITVLLFVGLNFQQVISRALVSGSDEAVSLRIFYDKLAGQTTGHYPWLGVGIGAFVPKLMQTLSHIPVYYYQPVHNIYLLISAETGIFGVASFLAFLFFLLRSYIQKNSLKDPQKFGLFLVCVTLLAIGVFDHLLWTIQQGRIVFWLVLALLL